MPAPKTAKEACRSRAGLQVEVPDALKELLLRPEASAVEAGSKSSTSNPAQPQESGTADDAVITRRYGGAHPVYRWREAGRAGLRSRPQYGSADARSCRECSQPGVPDHEEPRGQRADNDAPLQGHSMC